MISFFSLVHRPSHPTACGLQCVGEGLVKLVTSQETGAIYAPNLFNSYQLLTMWRR